MKTNYNFLPETILLLLGPSKPVESVQNLCHFRDIEKIAINVSFEVFSLNCLEENSTNEFQIDSDYLNLKYDIQYLKI